MSGFDAMAAVGAAAQLFDDAAVPVLTDYVRIPCLSPAFDPSWEANGHIGRAAELLADWARSRGLAGMTVEIHAPAGRTPLLLCEIPATPGAEGAGSVLLYGHLDKQPPFLPWREGLGPFEPVLEDDRLYGRGAADDGYSLFAALLAIESCVAAGGAHGRCVVVIEASEESSSVDLDAHLEELGERIGEPSLVVCLDSGCGSYDGFWVTSSLRGMLLVTVRVEVLEVGVHSGSAGGVVPSSFRILRQLMSRVEDEVTGELLLPELQAPVPPERMAEMKAVALELGAAAGGSFPVVAGLELTGSTPVEQLTNRTWRGSLATTGIDGVPAVADAGNVLRPSTTARLAIRLPPTSDSAAAATAVRRALTTDVPSGASVSVGTVTADGWNAPPMADWLARAVSDGSVAAFGREHRFIGEGGTIPFVGDLSRRFPSAQFLATGVLGPDSNAHGPNESLHLPTARALTAVVAHVLDAHARRGTLTG
jgi:acetylornithine deacetylase/succinyl-diaminopimelate desuccinylase-like protein